MNTLSCYLNILQDVSNALLAPVIAIFGIYIAYHQHIIHKNKIKLDLYEKRYLIYTAIKEYLGDILRNGKTSTERATEFFIKTRDSLFLFDTEVYEHVERIYRESLDLWELHEMIYPSDNSPGIPPGEERTSIVKKKSEKLKWLISQSEKTQNLFKPYLTIIIH